jgi:hypothetical protein
MPYLTRVKKDTKVIATYGKCLVYSIHQNQRFLPFSILSFLQGVVKMKETKTIHPKIKNLSTPVHRINPIHKDKDWWYLCIYFKENMYVYLPFSVARWLRKPAGELLCRTKDPAPCAISFKPYDLCNPPPPPLLGAFRSQLDELTLQVDSEVIEDDSPEKCCWRPTRGVDPRPESSRSAPMTESTARVRKEPGAEPYLVSPLGRLDFCGEEEDDDGCWYMMRAAQASSHNSTVGCYC